MTLRVLSVAVYDSLWRNSNQATGLALFFADTRLQYLHMATRDTMPPLRPDRPFPVGSMVEPEKEKHANEWLLNLEVLTDKEFLERTKTLSSRPALAGLSGIYKTHIAAITLCDDWDGGREIQNDLAKSGYIIGAAFNNDVQYLPLRSVDFSEQMKRMQALRQHMVPAFAQTAWKSMAAYGHVHDKFSRLFEQGRRRFEMYSDDDRDFFRAGLALPYMISWASSLAHNTPAFTGLSTQTDQKINIQSDDFRAIFTVDR